MSIGEALAAARHQAGLTVTQVSRQTRIRETIIRDIENDDYSACGGDFYARGHIRSLAKVAGADPEPLIREYDTTHQAPPQTATLADFFAGMPTTPGTPAGTEVKTRERRQLNQATALALVLALVVALGFVACGVLTGSRHTTSDAPQARAQPTTHHRLDPNRQATAAAPARPTLQPQTPTPVSAVALGPDNGKGDSAPARAARDRPQTHPRQAHRLAHHRPLREPVPGHRPAPRHRSHGSDRRRPEHPRQRRAGQRCHDCAGPGRHHG